MAFFGVIEKNNRSGLTCLPIMPKSVAIRKKKSWWFQLFCTGGVDPADPDNPIDHQEHWMMAFFRDVVAEGLNKTSMKILVIVIFFIYLIIGIYGCTQVKEGLDRRKLSRDDSYSVKYYDYDDRFFREYPYRVQVVINQTMNYADPAVQEKVDKVLSRFESSPYVAEASLTESWLRSYLHFIRQEDSYIFLQSLNLTNQEDFYTGLKSIFLHLPMTETFRNDIVWNADGTEIIATRYVIQTHDIKDANMEKEMLLELRRIADEFKDDNVSIFNHLFIFFDQFILVRDISLQTITIAAVVMMAISLFFIPSPSCAIWVAFSIISIEIGVVGYMTHWGVNLDSISMINLIMCIGFSVDFSAHISYAYISCDEPTSRERIKYALHSLGLPIFQGSVSTILGIVALAFAPSYVFLTFFKTVFLVMLFGATHGVLLLPVLLSLTDSCFRLDKSSNSDLDAPISKHCHHHPLNSSQSSRKGQKGLPPLPLPPPPSATHLYVPPDQYHHVFALSSNSKKDGKDLRILHHPHQLNIPIHSRNRSGSCFLPSSSTPYSPPPAKRRHSNKHNHLHPHQLQSAPTTPYFYIHDSHLLLDSTTSSSSSHMFGGVDNPVGPHHHHHHQVPLPFYIPRVSIVEQGRINHIPTNTSSSNESSPVSTSSSKWKPSAAATTTVNYSSNWILQDADSGKGSKSATSSEGGGETCQNSPKETSGTSGEELVYSEGSTNKQSARHCKDRKTGKGKTRKRRNN